VSADRPRWHERISLRLRMVLIAAVAVAVVVTLGGALVLLAVRAELIDTADNVAEARADQIVDLAQRGKLPAELVSDDDLEAAAQVVREGDVVAATQNAQGPGFFDVPAQRPGFEEVFEVSRLPIDDDGPYRVTAVGTETPLGDATVFVAVDVEDIEEALAALVSYGVIGLVFLLLAVSAVCWVVIGRTLAPVDAISQRAELVTGQRLDQRVPVPPAKDEVHRLARTINDMLTRLELSARRQERFVADAAHELRTPLATLRVRLETALARGRAEADAQLLPDLLAETVRLSSLVDQLLMLARSDAGIMRPGVTPVDLDDLVRDVVASNQQQVVTVRLDVLHPVQVRGEPTLLEQVVRNLVENAARHARTSVDVSVSSEQDDAVLTVDDDGPGIPQQARTDVLHRFVRLNGSRQRSDGGVGLGLAIVDEIVRLHAGTVEIAESPAHGARLCVRLPAS
jgi:signal transduction histidine kinase